MTDIEEELLTKAEFASVAGVTVHTVDKWIVRGAGPKRVLIGRRVFFRRTDVADWIRTLETR